MSPLAQLNEMLALRFAQQTGRMNPMLMLAIQNGMARGGPAGGPLSALKQSTPGSLVQGQGGGQDDNVPAVLSPGEYVWDADTVSAVGDGNNEEGARRLDEVRERIRAKKRSAPASKIPPKTGRLENYMQGIR